MRQLDLNSVSSDAEAVVTLPSRFEKHRDRSLCAQIRGLKDSLIDGRSRWCLSLALAIAMFSLAGCPPPSSHPPSSAQVDSDVVHTVTFKGETLGLIAAWYTGSAENWEAVAAANPGLQVTKIRLGDVITIPGQLVVQRDPLPQKAVSGRSSTSKPTSASGRSSSGDSKQSSQTANDSSQSGASPIPPSGEPSAPEDLAPSRPTPVSVPSSGEYLDDLLEGEEAPPRREPEGAVPSKVVPEPTLSEAERIRLEAIRQAETTTKAAVEESNDVLAEAERLNGVPPPQPRDSAPVVPTAKADDSGAGGGIKTRDELLEELLN